MLSWEWLRGKNVSRNFDEGCNCNFADGIALCGNVAMIVKDQVISAAAIGFAASPGSAFCGQVSRRKSMDQFR